MIRKFSMTAVAAAALCGTVSAANATVFGGSATFTDLTTGNPLTVTALPNPKTFATGSISAGGSDYFSGFMALLTTDTQGGLPCFFGCTATDQVSLSFSWSSPSSAPGTTQNGSVSQTDFAIASYDNGNLQWANDTHVDSNGTYAEQLVTFTDGAQAYVDVYDAAIRGTTTSESTQFDVRIRDVRDPIPEPMTLSLLGAGFLGLGLAKRHRKA